MELNLGNNPVPLTLLNQLGGLNKNGYANNPEPVQLPSFLKATQPPLPIMRYIYQLIMFLSLIKDISSFI